MRLTLGLAALLALSGAAAAHYGGDDLWHDFGTDLGAFGPGPAGAPVGVCWFTDSTFLDVDDPGGLNPAELWGHHAGLGVDYDGDCAQQAESPSVFGVMESPAEGEAGLGLNFGVGLPPMPPVMAWLRPLPEEPALPPL